MAYDTPATIAILGAGPIGLEAALYARYLGYQVLIFERGMVGDSIRRWGHVTLFTPFRMNRSPLSLAALSAQDPQWQPPGDDALLTGQEYVARFLDPLAASDLLYDSLHLNTSIIAVGRGNALKGDSVGDSQRAEQPFQILASHAKQGEEVYTADIVIDCTGTYGNHNWLGQGGIPAVGEQCVEADIEYGIPDVLGARREHYAGHSVIVLGSGYSAATTVVALAKLAGEAIGTHIEWVTRRDQSESDTGPLPRIAEDQLASRDTLARAANQLASDRNGGPVHHRAGCWIERIEWGSDRHRHRVHLSGKQREVLEVDRLIAQVGYRPNRKIYSELQFHECYAGDGPMRLAVQLMEHKSEDCLQQIAAPAEALLNPEPNFYVLGAKSYGRNSNFLISTGLKQIRDLFSIIGDRSDLDLYANAPLASTEQ